MYEEKNEENEVDVVSIELLYEGEGGVDLGFRLLGGVDVYLGEDIGNCCDDEVEVDVLDLIFVDDDFMYRVFIM